MGLRRFKDGGFSLIELMVALTIVAILAAIALPTYFDQVRKSRRADARAALATISQRLERCFTDTTTYVGCITFPELSDEGHYSITAPTLTQSTFSLTAQPQGTQADDTFCGSFSLDHLNAKTVTNSIHTEACW